MAAQFKTPNSSTLRIKFALTVDGVLAPTGGTEVLKGQKQFSFKGINPNVEVTAFENFETYYLAGIFGVNYDSFNSSLSVIKPYDETATA